MKTVIEFTIKQGADNTYELHYIVPDFSGNKKESERGTVVMSSLARAVDRIDWITRYLRNPVKGKPMHDIMARIQTSGSIQNHNSKIDS